MTALGLQSASKLLLEKLWLCCDEKKQKKGLPPAALPVSSEQGEG